MARVGHFPSRVRRVYSFGVNHGGEPESEGPRILSAASSTVHGTLVMDAMEPTAAKPARLRSVWDPSCVGDDAPRGRCGSMATFPLERLGGRLTDTSTLT